MACARLQRAHSSTTFGPRNTKAGYKEIEPPVMVNEASGFGTPAPRQEVQMYHATVDNFGLCADG